jgi:hypothetical protein
MKKTASANNILMNKYIPTNRNSSLLHAETLGRVERLLGSTIDVNPFPKISKQWQAFRKGWLRALDDPISTNFRTRRSD